MRRRMLRDRLTRSAFELGPGRKPDGEAPSGLTVWSRDISQFAGRPDDGLALDGDTVTALVGGTTGWSPRGLAGIGWGGLDLADREFQGDTTLDADVSLRIAAAGVRQALASTRPG